MCEKKTQICWPKLNLESRCTRRDTDWIPTNACIRDEISVATWCWKVQQASLWNTTVVEIFRTDANVGEIWKQLRSKIQRRSRFLTNKYGYQTHCESGIVLGATVESNGVCQIAIDASPTSSSTRQQLSTISRSEQYQLGDWQIWFLYYLSAISR